MQFRINNSKPSPFQAIAGLLLLAVFIVGMFMLARFIFRILAWLSPLMLIAALILDYRTVVNYVKWVGGLLRSNVLTGILVIILSVVGFPLLSAFLAAKAFLMRSVRKARKEKEQSLEGEYVDYETLDNEVLDLPDHRERTREGRQTRSARDESYDRFFDE